MDQAMETLMKTHGIIGLPIVDAHAEFILPSKFDNLFLVPLVLVKLS